MFTTTAASTSLGPQLSTFVMPEPPLTPPDTHFDPEVPSAVQAWHTRSGHVLVLPRIDGKEIGYMMLDTGDDSLHPDLAWKCPRDAGLMHQHVVDFECAWSLNPHEQTAQEVEEI